MKVFLAGVNGRHWVIENVMKLYLAGGSGTKTSIQKAIKSEENMKLFLAGTPPWRAERLYDEAISKHRPYILESFYYVDDDTERLLPSYGDFLLDSGAFTFMQDNFEHLDWDDYIERYAAFIRRNNVAKFFELDIDVVVGYQKVKEYRKKLENLTGRQVIPVWHKNRGVEEFKKMCQEYPYVAIGATGKNEDSSWTKKNPEILNYFITTAHKHGCKIHGLGFTRIGMLEKFHFDSVDSTAWTTGNRFGFIYHFDGRTMQKIQCPKGKRLGKPKEVALINYIEWIKFQKYADSNL